MRVLDHGSVELVSSDALDLHVVNAARVSFNRQVVQMTEADKELLDYLMRSGHGSPFEHTFFRFRIKLPLFVVREWHRHRIGWSYNEQSGRYTEFEGEFYVPDYVRKQVGKPGAYQYVGMDQRDKEYVQDLVREANLDGYTAYRALLGHGVAREVARVVLPVNTYTTMVASCNARSLMHFLSLRSDEAAQYEIRCYAKALEDIFYEQMPITASAWNRHGRKAP